MKLLLITLFIGAASAFNWKWGGGRWGGGGQWGGGGRWGGGGQWGGGGRWGKYLLHYRNS